MLASSPRFPNCFPSTKSSFLWNDSKATRTRITSGVFRGWWKSFSRLTGHHPVTTRLGKYRTIT
jgi:hypothetical protein